MAVTVIVSVVSANKLPLSVTRKVKVEAVAPHAAIAAAVTLPEASTLMLSVTPEPESGVAVTTNALSASWMSLTVAI